MTKKKEPRQLYGGRKPKSYRLAHNHIMHTDATVHGERGFRRFLIPPQWVGKGWKKCPCGWHNGDAHYALSEHVDGWHKRIKATVISTSISRAALPPSWVDTWCK